MTDPTPIRPKLDTIAIGDADLAELRMIDARVRAAHERLGEVDAQLAMVEAARAQARAEALRWVQERQATSDRVGKSLGAPPGYVLDITQGVLRPK
jgi:hypothetical protein